MTLTEQQIAQACHENNRAYCHTLGDYSQPAWGFLSKEMQETTINGVRFHLANPDVSPKLAHENWMKDKAANGWVYGPSKDIMKKQHPNMIPYNDLPKEERTKDLLFGALVSILKTF